MRLCSFPFGALLLVASLWGCDESTRNTPPVPDSSPGDAQPDAQPGDAQPDAEPGDAQPDAQPTDAQPTDAQPDAQPDGAVVDVTAPQVSFLTPGDQTEVGGEVVVELLVQDESPVSVALFANDAPLFAADAPPYRWTWDATALPVGPYQLKAVATDAVGLIGEATVAIRLTSPCVEDCPPVLEIDLGDAPRCGLTAFTALATDELGAVAPTFQVDGQPIAVAHRSPDGLVVLDLRALAPGEHTLEMTATDLAGHVAFERRTLTVETCAEAASVAFLAPQSGEYLGDEANFAFAVEGPLDLVRLSRPEAVVGEARAPDFTLPGVWLADWPEAPQTLTAVGLSFETGRAALATIQVEVDKTAPVVTLVSPTESEAVTGLVTVRADVTDAVGVAQVTLALGEVTQVDETAPYEATFDTAGLPSGPVNVRVTAMDLAGHEGSISSTAIVDRAPTVAFVSPIANAVIRGPVTLSLQVQDDLGVARAQVFDGETLVGDIPASGQLAWTPAFVAGPRTLRAEVEDTAGRVAEASVAVRVDHPMTLTVSLCQGEDCRQAANGLELAGAYTLRINDADDDGPASRVVAALGGVRLGDLQARPFEMAVDTTAWADGPHRLAIDVITANQGFANAGFDLVVNNCDRDHDTFLAQGVCGGFDCDDASAEVNPRAADLTEDGVDQNCDGRDGQEPDAGEDAGVDDAGYPDGSLAPQGEWGPSARIVHMGFPDDPEAGRLAGCTVVGAAVGTTLPAWLAQIGINSIDPFITPDANGNAQVHVFNEFEGLAGGAPLSETAGVVLNLLTAAREHRRFLVHREALTDSADPDSAPRVSLPPTLIEATGEFETPEGTFELPLPWARSGGLPPVLLRVELTKAVGSGQIAVDGPGVELTDGMIQGYWTQAAVERWMTQVLATCALANPPQMCVFLSFLLGQNPTPDSAVAVLKANLGGFDVQWNNGNPTPCPTGQCDAISVCAFVSGPGALVHGVDEVNETICRLVCDQVADCATLTETCPGLAPVDRLAERSRCERACGSSVPLQDALDQLCPDLLLTYEGVSPTFAGRCAGN